MNTFSDMATVKIDWVQRFTKRLLDGAATLEIKLIDHIIIGFGGFYSFASESKMANRFGWY